ncbi:hypothetical protein MLD38_019529 [Melastoma candidum]|uniref:Uncharacterized protein n=1 Tax=Melastoma candidum TaxID=119954 RepID=A0ACB9QXV1_9MYRT|nr:hypothetical protein MLD38_019529 [Melastoma candidum]
MRIRKRQVPLPLSSLSPIPLSDPLFLLPSPNSNSNSKPPPPQIDPRVRLPSDDFPEGSNYHSRGPNNATAEKALAGTSSPAAEAVKRRSSSSNDDDYDDDDDKEYKWDVKMKGSSLGNNGGKRRGRGGVGVGGGGGGNAEGTRCSRVNGRGWRCGQLTLVGYSLCEHHLGKGRLRSMANVRGRSTIGTMETLRNEKEKPQKPPEPSLISGMREGDTFPGKNEEEDDEKEEDSTSTGPRKKARSMSSLLGQDNNDASISLP